MEGLAEGAKPELCRAKKITGVPTIVASVFFRCYSRLGRLGPLSSKNPTSRTQRRVLPVLEVSKQSEVTRFMLWLQSHFEPGATRHKGFIHTSGQLIEEIIS